MHTLFGAMTSYNLKIRAQKKVLVRGNERDIQLLCDASA